MKFNLSDFRDFLICTKENDIKSMTVTQDKFEIIINKETIKKFQPKITANHTRKTNQISLKQGRESVISSEVDNDIQPIDDVYSKESEISFTIVSPMVGTFYRSPGPSEPYFIETHDKVTTNQTVCIVEAMKLMNEIEAEVSGEVIEILVKDGEIVDCGQPLIRIKPD
uniref:Biotin carboxyl carrier protein of acetyl-CoA carboxylase n=1 Tax=Dermonema virens TaxID=1077399 RepID=A0A1G4NRY1_9FLOR|nr:Acetyl-CoA carboxylase, biotin carboxyl carrier protein [Dermonema virens]SCW21375.1 Acetyl-CoA carboxylase, biotin carboxyl carrier protein [Dermonema virens]